VRIDTIDLQRLGAVTMLASAERAGVKLRRTINNAAGERSEPAATEASAVSFNFSLASADS
jgi:hypothetical protein